MSVEARLISRGARDRAEVVVLMREGPRQRSVTRHVRRQGGQWMGRNPDEAGIAALDAAEVEVRNALGRHSALEETFQLQMKELERIAERIRQYREEAHVSSPVLQIGLTLLQTEQELKAKAMARATKAAVSGAKERLQAAIARERDLSRRFPRYVEFSF